MNFETNINIDDYIKALNLKILELKLAQKKAFNKELQNRYNSFLNKKIFKKSLSYLKEQLILQLYAYKSYSSENKIYFINKYTNEINIYEVLIAKLNVSKSLGNTTVKIQDNTMSFFGNYLQNPSYEKLILSELEKINEE